MDFTLIISLEDLNTLTIKKGYDFLSDDVLDTTHFNTTEEACADLFQNSFDTLVSLIEENRGTIWTDLFLEDMSIDGMESTDDNQTKIHDRFISALVEQCIFTYDCGDSDASSLKENENQPYSPKAVKKLWKRVIF